MELVFGSFLLCWPLLFLIFGTKKFKNIGGDLGGAVKGFKKAMSEDADKKEEDDDKKQLKQEDADFTEAKKADVKDEQKSDK